MKLIGAVLTLGGLLSQYALAFDLSCEPGRFGDRGTETSIDDHYRFQISQRCFATISAQDEEINLAARHREELLKRSNISIVDTDADLPENQLRITETWETPSYMEITSTASFEGDSNWSKFEARCNDKEDLKASGNADLAQKVYRSVLITKSHPTRLQIDITKEVIVRKPGFVPRWFVESLFSSKVRDGIKTDMKLLQDLNKTMLNNIYQ